MVNPTKNRVVVIGLFLLIAGVSGTAQGQQTDSGTPEAQISYARGFEVQNKPYGHRLSVLHPFANAEDTLVYRLVDEDWKGELEQQTGAQTIRKPVRRIIILSTTHVGILKWLNIEDRIVGISDKSYVVDASVRRQIREGEIEPIGQNGQFDFEKIIALQPDLVVTIGRKVQQWNELQLLRDNGIPVLVNAEWMEKTPLGRAEWAKAIALCAGKYGLAREKFHKVAAEYQRADQLTSTVRDSPSVILNTSYKGTWFVPGGTSYMATYLEDAGAVYPWRGEKQRHSLRLDFESAFNQALKVDYWIHPGTAKSLKELQRKDSRYRHIPAVKNEGVYNNNKQETEEGGNPYWEKGLMEPDVILKDLITIFHPDLFPDRETVYYHKLD